MITCYNYFLSFLTLWIDVPLYYVCRYFEQGHLQVTCRKLVATHIYIIEFPRHQKGFFLNSKMNFLILNQSNCLYFFVLIIWYTKDSIFTKMQLIYCRKISHNSYLYYLSLSLLFDSLSLTVNDFFNFCLHLL